MPHIIIPTPSKSTTQAYVSLEDFPLHVHCCGLKTVLFTNKLERSCHIINPFPYLQSFMHPSIFVRELHKNAYTHCCLLWCENGIVCQQVIRMLVSYHYVVSLIPTCLQSFIHPSVLVRELHNMHVHIVLCCGAKRVLFTNKLSECWCRISIPYLFTKCHASKHFGKRVTQTCMPYCNVWAEVVYCGFPKSKVFTKTLICLFPEHHQSLYLHQVS